MTSDRYEVWLALGDEYKRQGNHRQAVAMYRKALDCLRSTEG